MRAGSKKKAASSRSKSRPKSKGKKASFIGNGAIKKEFNNFKRVMTAGASKPGKHYLTQRQQQQQEDEFDSLVASPVTH
jgi:hypothetical protein